MTDIWRSFVAQRCLWELGTGVVFHSPDMVQDRNEHKLMRDFEQEVPGYLGNERLCDVLAASALSASPAAVADNLFSCYRVLVREGFLPDSELPLVEAWLEDIGRVPIVESNGGGELAVEG